VRGDSGNVGMVKEITREKWVWGSPTADADLRFGMRMPARSPGLRRGDF